LLTIALNLRVHEIVLVDEIENGIFHTSLEPLWRWIGRLAESRGAQVFCTTHSYECIQAAAKALDTYDARLFRLERRDDQVVAVSADGEALKAAAEHGLEVR
jgi:predicted ATPase